MKSFYNKLTGVTLTPRNKWVEEQLEADERFQEVGTKAKASKESTETKKAIKDYTKKELVALLQSLRLEDVNEEMKKDDLLALVPEDYEAE